jgi:putative lipoprotein
VNTRHPARAAIVAACCISGLAAAACASSAPDAILSNTAWTVQSINGSPVSQRAPSIEFNGDRVAGTGSCNRYFGGYDITGAETIVLTGIGSTEMACEPAVMAQEAAYFDALGSVRAYRRDGDELTLSSVSGPVLVLRRAS